MVGSKLYCLRFCPRDEGQYFKKGTSFHMCSNDYYLTKFCTQPNSSLRYFSVAETMVEVWGEGGNGLGWLAWGPIHTA